MEVSADQVVAVLQQRAQQDRLIAEILRAAILEAAAVAAETEEEPDTDEGQE